MMSDTITLNEKALEAARYSVKSQALFNPIADVSTLADAAVRTYLACLPSPDRAVHITHSSMEDWREDEMTLNLAELRRLEAEATPGPWSEEAPPFTLENIALIVAMRNALPGLLKALEATDELIEALAIYGFPVSDAAETALLNRGVGTREAQRLHKAAKALIAARKALSPQGGVNVG